MLATREMIQPDYIFSLIAEALKTEPLDHSDLKEDCTPRQWRDFVLALRSYKLVKISAEQWERWLEVLPPAAMGRGYFLFAEGEELPILFFGKGEGRYYAMRMKYSDPARQAEIELTDAYYAEVLNPRRATVYREWRHGHKGTMFYFVNANQIELLDSDIIAFMAERGYVQQGNSVMFQAPRTLTENEIAEVARTGRFPFEIYRG